MILFYSTYFWKKNSLTLDKGIVLSGQIKMLAILSYKNTERSKCMRQ